VSNPLLKIEWSILDAGANIIPPKLPDIADALCLRQYFALGCIWYE